jgi:hypothetical protein
VAIFRWGWILYRSTSSAVHLQYLLSTMCLSKAGTVELSIRILPKVRRSRLGRELIGCMSRMLIGLRLLRQQQGFSTPPLRWYPNHLSLYLFTSSLRPHSSSMSHSVASSGPVQIPALVGQHTDVVSGKELKPPKEKKPKAAPVSQFPLEVRRHSTIISSMHDSYVSHQLQPPPDFFDHRVKIFEELKAEYDAFVQGLPLCFSTLK